MKTYFGGLDLAKRVDYSAFVLLELKDGHLTQRGQKIWPHINYRVVANDMYKINQKYRMRLIGFDRSGVGDGAQELFSRELPMKPIISSLPTKMEIINFLHSLFHNKKLLIKDKELYKQILEQEEHKSEAGNILYRHPSNRHDDLFWALGYACYAAKGMLQGRPSYVMRRKDREINKFSNKIDENLKNTLGKEWSFSGH